MALPKTADILEACPRDGWQNHPFIIPAEMKIDYIKKMIDYGAKRMDLTSFVSPKYVPQMATAFDVVAGVKDYAAEKGCRLYGLTLNAKGVENAMKAGMEYVSFVISVSSEHQMRNSRRTIEQSRESFRELVPKAEGLKIQLALPCVFGSPFGDEIDMGLVKDIIQEAFSLGIKEIGLADTAGLSTPVHTREVLSQIREYCDPDLTTIHLHDTYGMGIANAYVALEEGYRKFDASLGGMGGCPFVPGAKGNIATEDLVYMCEKIGVETGYDLDAVVATAIAMGKDIDAEISSSVSKALACHE